MPNRIAHRICLEFLYRSHTKVSRKHLGETETVLHWFCSTNVIWQADDVHIMLQQLLVVAVAQGTRRRSIRSTNIWSLLRACFTAEGQIVNRISVKRSPRNFSERSFHHKHFGIKIANGHSSQDKYTVGVTVCWTDTNTSQSSETTEHSPVPTPQGHFKLL